MTEEFTSILYKLLQPPEKEGGNFSILDITKELNEKRIDAVGTAQSLNAAFLIALLTLPASSL